MGLNPSLALNRNAVFSSKNISEINNQRKLLPKSCAAVPYPPQDGLIKTCPENLEKHECHTQDGHQLPPETLQTEPAALEYYRPFLFQINTVLLNSLFICES